MTKIILLPSYGPPFSPLDVAGMIFWHDFSDTSTLWQDAGGTIPVTITGDPIGRVDDKSVSFTRNLVNAGAVPTPWDSAGQNGLGTAKFDHVVAGGYQILRHFAALVQPSPFTYFIAATTPYLTTVSTVTAQNGCGGNLFLYDVLSSSPVRVHNGTQLNTTLPFATFRSVTIEANVTTTVWDQTVIDTIGNMGTAGQSAHQLGAWCNAPLSGLGTAPGPTHIGEVLEYAGALAPADVTKIQNYLINKWGA